MNGIQQSANIGNVTLKIIQVASELGAIQKKKMQGGVNANYPYFAIEDVMAAVSSAMERRNLWIMPSCVGIDASETALIYHFVFMVVDQESGEWMQLPFSQSNSSGSYQHVKEANVMVFKSAKDQTAGMIDSYAYKNFVLKLFGISTPDADTEEAKRIARENKVNDRRLPVQSSIVNIDENGEPILPPIEDSDKRLDAIQSVSEDSEKQITDKQHKALITRFSTLKFSDDERHKAIIALTNGVTQSSKEITQGEFKRLMDLLKVWELGNLASDWLDKIVYVAPKVSDNTVTAFFALNEVQVVLAHSQVLAWVKAHKGVIVPARFEKLS